MPYMSQGSGTSRHFEKLHQAPWWCT